MRNPEDPETWVGPKSPLSAVGWFVEARSAASHRTAFSHQAEVFALAAQRPTREVASEGQSPGPTPARRNLLMRLALASGLWQRVFRRSGSLGLQ